MESSGHRFSLAFILTTICVAAEADSPPRIAFQEFEYFPSYVGDLPPPVDTAVVVRTRGVVRTPGNEARKASWMRRRGREVTQGSDSRDSDARWLRGRFMLESDPNGVQALYISAAIRGVRAFVNGIELGHSSISEAELFGWNYPLLFTIPSSLLHAGHNSVDLRLALTPGGWGNVRGVMLGPHDALRPQYDQVLFWRVTGPRITSLVAVLAGAIALLIWLRRRGETIFAWFALACLFGAVRNAQYYVTAQNLVGWYEVWAAVSLQWMSAALAIFSIRLCQRRLPRVERTLLWAALAWSVAIAPNGRYTLLAVDVGNLWLVAVNIGILAFVLTECLQRPGVDRILLLVAVGVTLVFGAMDLTMFLGLRHSEWRVHLLPYSTLVFAPVMGAVLVDAFAKARTRQEMISQELDARLAVRERQLRDQHRTLLKLETERATSAERQRILRDIHDGLGSQLITSIRLVEGGALESAGVAALLRECVDDLRLAIDSLKPSGNDLLAVLGNFRYRMEPRLAHAGVRLAWDVRSDARSPALGAEQVLQVLRIVQEAVTNSLKHAHPKRLEVRYRDDTASGDWELAIEDDGAGFQARSPPQRGDGLRNMRARAVQAGLEFEFEGGPSGVTVRIGTGARVAPPSTASSGTQAR